MNEAMSQARRRVTAIGAPILTLGVVAAAAWLLSSREELGLGPTRALPFTPRLAAPSSFQEGLPPPTLLEHISPLQAELRNALLPFSHAPLPMSMRYQNAAGRETPAVALQCMSEAIYYEAGHEPLAGKRAVAQVILNRTASPPFPKTVCGVVQQGAPRPGCQFTFMCDGSLARRPDPASWAAAQDVARAALSGDVDAGVGGATHYHADYVFPVWAPTMLKLVKIGRHIFYRWPGAHIVPAEIAPTAANGLTGSTFVEPTANPSLASPIPPLGSPTQVGQDTLASTASPSPAAAAASPVSRAEGVPPAAVDAPPTRIEPSPRPPAVPRRAVPQQSLRTGPV